MTLFVTKKELQTSWELPKLNASITWDHEDKIAIIWGISGTIYGLEDLKAIRDLFEAVIEEVEND